MSSLMGDSSSLNLAEEAEKRTSWLAAGMEMVLTEAGQHTAGGPEALNSLSLALYALDGAPKKTRIMNRGDFGGAGASWLLRLGH